MNLVAWNIVVGLVALVATVATGYRCWRYRRLLERKLETAPAPLPRASGAPAPASTGVLGVLPLAVGLLAALALVAMAAPVLATADRFFTPTSAVTALLGILGGLLLLLAVEPVTALLVVARAYPWNDPERAGRAQAEVARRRWLLELLLLVAASSLVAVTGTRFGVLGVPSGAGEAAVDGAKRFVLTHFDAGIYQSLPERKESEAVAAGIFPATTAGMDGLELML